MDNEKGKSIISTGSSNLAKTEKLLSITQKILSEIKPQFDSIKIGNQEWMTRNLDVDRFRNGELIPHIEINEEWIKVCENQQPAWCYYDNDHENGKKYGKLYNWYAVNDPRGLAPEGWHIPSDEEWTTLINYLGEDDMGHKMKSVQGWNSWEDEAGEFQNGNGDNSSGFNGIPAGLRYYNGGFDYLGEDGDWWSSTDLDYYNALSLSLNFNNSYVYRNSYEYGKGDGLSVRCLRD